MMSAMPLPKKTLGACLLALLAGQLLGAGVACAGTPPAPVAASAPDAGADAAGAAGPDDPQPVDTSLQSQGIGLGGWLQSDLSSVPSGGKPGAKPVAGQYLLDLSATVDTGKLFGWRGGTLFVDAQLHGGNNILTSQMPAIQDPDNMDASATRSIDRAWYQQQLMGKKLQWRIGRMYVDDQFLAVPYGQNFVSLDFSSDASISTFVLPTYPKGSNGADAFFHPTPGLYFSGGVFRDHSTELPYDPGGDLYITEEGWQGSWNAHPYAFQLGAWRDTGRFERLSDGTAQHGAGGLYLIASGQLWQPASGAGRGLGMFVQFGTAPAAVAAIRRHYGAGLVWTGPVAGRSQDEIGIAFSDGLLTRQNGFTYGFEKEFEAYYRIQVRHRLTVQPDLEFWRHPNGSDRDTTLLLVRVQYSFGAAGS